MKNINLIEKRNEILENMVNYFMKDKKLIGIFLSGSLAEESSDKYSDIDFRVILEDEGIDNYINNRLTAPENWGELLYNEYSSGWKNMCVSHFKPFVKVDIFYYTKHDLTPSVWHNKGIKIIYDRDGFISEIIEKSKNLKIETNIEDINISINKGIALIHETYRRAKRDEIVYANDLLNGLRHKLIEFNDLLNNRINEGSSHYEKRGTEELKNILHKSYSTKTQKDILEILFKLTKVFEMKLKMINEKYLLQRNEKNDEYSIKIIWELENCI